MLHRYNQDYIITWTKHQLEGGAAGAQSFVNIRNGGVVQGLDWRDS